MMCPIYPPPPPNPLIIWLEKWEVTYLIYRLIPKIRMLPFVLHRLKYDLFGEEYKLQVFENKVKFQITVSSI
jgi:hypothetical protein